MTVKAGVEWLSPWFDKLADFARTKREKERAVCDLMEAICYKFPSHKNLLAMLNVVNIAATTMPHKRKLFLEIIASINTVLSGGARKDFRISYHRYPNWSGQCSATGSLFSALYQALTYDRPYDPKAGPINPTAPWC